MLLHHLSSNNNNRRILPALTPNMRNTIRIKSALRNRVSWLIFSPIRKKFFNAHTIYIPWFVSITFASIIITHGSASFGLWLFIDCVQSIFIFPVHFSCLLDAIIFLCSSIPSSSLPEQKKNCEIFCFLLLINVIYSYILRETRQISRKSNWIFQSMHFSSESSSWKWIDASFDENSSYGASRYNILLNERSSLIW